MIKPGTFDIRYVKLRFTIEFPDGGAVPVYKTSALRGGMGEMLLRTNCVRDRVCEKCDFETECIVRRIMYPKLDILPSFMSSGDSVGFVIECNDYRDNLHPGDLLRFNLLLFGKTIVYFSQFLNAFYALGRNGLGTEKSRFQIVSVTNIRGKPIVEGENVYMKNYTIERVTDCIAFRKKQFTGDDSERTIRFTTPLSVKYRGKLLERFVPEALIEAACRRIYMLDCFEGIDSNVHDKDFIETLTVPETVRETHVSYSVRRYSNHQGSAMYLNGIEGELCVDEFGDELLEIMLAGELLHIGKTTSFGFGEYRIA